jgi:hypothetical protein
MANLAGIGIGLANTGSQIGEGILQGEDIKRQRALQDLQAQQMRAPKTLGMQRDAMGNVYAIQQDPASGAITTKRIINAPDYSKVFQSVLSSLSPEERQTIGPLLPAYMQTGDIGGMLRTISSTRQRQQQFQQQQEAQEKQFERQQTLQVLRDTDSINRMKALWAHQDAIQQQHDQLMMQLESRREAASDARTQATLTASMKRADMQFQATMGRVQAAEDAIKQRASAAAASNAAKGALSVTQGQQTAPQAWYSKLVGLTPGTKTVQTIKGSPGAVSAYNQLKAKGLDIGSVVTVNYGGKPVKARIVGITSDGQVQYQKVGQ